MDVLAILEQFEEVADQAPVGDVGSGTRFSGIVRRALRIAAKLVQHRLLRKTLADVGARVAAHWRHKHPTARTRITQDIRMLVLYLKEPIILDLGLDSGATASPPNKEVGVPASLLIGVPVDELAGAALALVVSRF